MSTLSDFKAALVVGETYAVVNHVYPELSGRRTLLRKQSTKAEWTLPTDHPRYEASRGSWFDFPKAANVRYEGSWFVVDRAAEWGDPGPFFSMSKIPLAMLAEA